GFRVPLHPSGLPARRPPDPAADAGARGVRLRVRHGGAAARAVLRASARHERLRVRGRGPDGRAGGVAAGVGARHHPGDRHRDRGRQQPHGAGGRSDPALAQGRAPGTACRQPVLPHGCQLAHRHPLPGGGRPGCRGAVRRRHRPVGALGRRDGAGLPRGRPRRRAAPLRPRRRDADLLQRHAGAALARSAGRPALGRGRGGRTRRAGPGAGLCLHRRRRTGRRRRGSVPGM
ncbi:MAG: hypothetical protein AVDCRST_MAG79-1474, partial [uncultured Thermoleophilia bacterium]